MTPEQKAAAAQALANATAVAENGLAAGASAQASDADTPEGGAAAVAAAAAATAAATTETTQEQPGADVVASLTEKLESRAVELANVRAELATAQAALEASQAVTKNLATIVQASINGMGIAMNTQVAGLDKMEPAALVEAHADMSAKFKEKFKAGGVSATPAKAEAATRAQASTPVYTEADRARFKL